jgi:muramoyltetrapeptide carboxypeptidase LdcA involved in peptidoglycan recycling
MLRSLAVTMKFVIPPCLKPGDKVAIVSPPAGCAYLFPSVYELGLQRLRSLNAAFADSSIKAIITTTGNNNCIPIMPYLNRAIIASHPKIFMGYSDITNMHVSGIVWGGCLEILQLLTPGKVKFFALWP